MESVILSNPKRLLKPLCFLVLAFVPVNMLFTPLYDYATVQQRGVNWTVTLSAFAALLTAIPLLAVALLMLKSRSEKIFIWSITAFFIYAFLYSIYIAPALFYPIYGLTSVLAATLVAILFYVSIRESIISHRQVFHFLITAAALVVVPLLLVQFDPQRFGVLAERYGAGNILYGYENPRALGWSVTIGLSLIAAFIVTQPKEQGIQPLFLLLVVMASTTLFWSGSRGGVVAFTLSLIFVFSFSRTRNATGLLLVLACVVAGGAISFVLHTPGSSFGVFSRVSSNLSQADLNAVSSGRAELWQLTLSYIMERPFTGYGYLPHKNLDGFTHGSAHNFILDAWLWFGFIIGTIVTLAGALLWFIAAAFFRRADDHYVAALFCVVTTLFAYSLISGPYARTFPLLLFAITCGTLLGLRSLRVR